MKKSFRWVACVCVWHSVSALFCLAFFNHFNVHCSKCKLPKACQE